MFLHHVLLSSGIPGKYPVSLFFLQYLACSSLRQQDTRHTSEIEVNEMRILSDPDAQSSDKDSLIYGRYGQVCVADLVILVGGGSGLSQVFPGSSYLQVQTSRC